ETATNPYLLCRGTALHRDEKEREHDNEKPVSDRNKSSPRHPRHSRRESRVGAQHRDERRGEHPRQSIHVARANTVADWLGYVIAGQDQKMKKKPEPERADFVRLNVDNLGEEFFQARLCQTASTSVSRSAVRPARNFDPRSCGSDLNQLSVSRAVSAGGRNVKPFAKTRLILVRARPLSFPVQTGMSDHGSTFCWVRNSSFTQVKVAFDFFESLIPSSIAPMPSGFAGPVAL